ncbi:MAG: hypothetical protein KC441_19460, partial [Anaerolineales bacterium]|nr:hypothetical protein [Anaerolineales bacterium]
MTLISAPPGYGKSVLASMWQEASGLPSGWVSLDESDNDLFIFVSYLLAAIETAVPHTPLQTQTLLSDSSFTAAANLARYLLADLNQIDTPFLLVLDDIHTIREQSVFDFLETLLNHPSPALHLVLVGRQDPPLRIASMRAYGRITEIRMRDLRFTPSETSLFLNRMLERDISKSVAAEWTDKTEGWIVALRLAALSLRYRPPSRQLSAHAPGNNQFLQEYLLAEVLARLPAPLQSYLLKSALLDRFCAPLWEAVVLDERDDGRPEMTGESFIQWLQQSNLFLISLDQQNEWFRFH